MREIPGRESSISSVSPRREGVSRVNSFAEAYARVHIAEVERSASPWFL